MELSSGHYVAIFGGSVAGSEAASELAKRGIRSAVFEQYALPYGKLESGLPIWHMNLRDRQEGIINEKLQNDLIEFIPMTKLGKDIDFVKFVKTQGFSAVLLATGAWRDRPIPAKGFDEFIGKGFHYQNPFVNWFNHRHEPDYNGIRFDVPDGTIIIGGGLASLDVAKIAMLEIVRKALAKKGTDIDILTLERKGIDSILNALNLTLNDLGVEGCTLYTRQSIREMPLNPIPENAEGEQLEKLYASRGKILKRVMDKYLFKLQENRVAVEPINENDRMVGAVFQETRTDGEKITNVENSFKSIKTQLIISAIGSIPDQIPGIPLKGEIYDVEDTETGKIRGYDNVFALGNAVTGRGNIRQSQAHGRQVSENIVDQYLAWQEEDYEEIFDSASDRVDSRVVSIGERLKEVTPLSVNKMKAIHRQVKEMQNKVGYEGNYTKWIADHLPPRLEKIIGYKKS
ncbi:MAG: FAD-dependent oxidoreductase [Calditrichaceae bacterium]